MVKMFRFETSYLEMGIKTLMIEMGHQLPPSIAPIFASSATLPRFTLLKIAPIDNYWTPFPIQHSLYALLQEIRK